MAKFSLESETTDSKPLSGSEQKVMLDVFFSIEAFVNSPAIYRVAIDKLSLRDDYFHGITFCSLPRLFID